MCRLLTLALLVACPLTAAAAEPAYQPTAENLKAREWFQDAKFGLFIHWGVYAVLGDGEWVMNNHKMTVAEYEKLPPQFNPTEYDPAAWVKLAKDAGMKYITITSKHHDGFAMWDSKVSDWDIVDRTPYKKDVLKLLADECKKQDVKLFFYHSHLDWHHPDYFPRGRTGNNTGRPDKGDFNKYLDFMDAQLEELLTGYGPVGGIWFDGWWDQQVKEKGGDPKQTKVDWRLRQTYDRIHKLQPACLVGNNHHVAPFPGEDFQMFEKDLPGANTAGFNADSKPGDLPLETCETINGAWGYNKSDKKFKSTKDLVHYLVRAAGNNANFLLNVGPTPSGNIQPEFVERLREVGKWLEKNGESVYNTRGYAPPKNNLGAGTNTPANAVALTQSKAGDKLYVHVLDPKLDRVVVPVEPKFFSRKLRLLDGNKALDGGISALNQLVVDLPKEGRDPYDTVVVIEAGK